MIAVAQSPIFASNESGAHTTAHRTKAAEIAAVRRHLAARAEGQPTAVKRAVANLDRWLEVLTEPLETRVGVDASRCALAAVEMVESALRCSGEK